MAVILFLFLLAILYANLKKSALKALSIAFLTAVGVLICVVVFDRGYNYALRKEFSGHVDDNRFVTTMVIYTADREYADYIEDAEVRQVFLDIYDICDSKGYLMNNAPKNWYDACDHFSDHYDLIQLDTMVAYLKEVVPNMEYAGEVSNDEVRMDLVKAEINRSLLPHEIPRIMEVMKNNFFNGMVNTVAKRTPLLCIYSLLAYLAYAFLYITLIIMGKKKGFTFSCKSTLIFATFTMISIVANVLLVSAVIFSQTRYVIYNMPAFYIALVLMMVEGYRFLRKSPSHHFFNKS